MVVKSSDKAVMNRDSSAKLVSKDAIRRAAIRQTHRTGRTELRTVTAWPYYTRFTRQTRQLQVQQAAQPLTMKLKTRI